MSVCRLIGYDIHIRGVFLETAPSSVFPFVLHPSCPVSALKRLLACINSNYSTTLVILRLVRYSSRSTRTCRVDFFSWLFPAALCCHGSFNPNSQPRPSYPARRSFAVTAQLRYDPFQVRLPPGGCHAAQPSDSAPKAEFGRVR